MEVCSQDLAKMNVSFHINTGADARPGFFWHGEWSFFQSIFCQVLVKIYNCG